MDTKQHQHLEDLRRTLQRRLNILERQAATYGLSVPPHILLEIEDIQEKITSIDKQLNADGVNPHAVTQVNTGGGTYVGRDINAGRDVAGRDIIITQNFSARRLVSEFEEKDWEMIIDKGFELNIDHNFGYLPQVSVMLKNGTEVEIAIVRNENYVRLGSNIRFAGKALLS